jgi:glycosyltransferase involved in cell wall biosynthesis
MLYLLSASGNRLYDGRYELDSRYLTYGQQSFIYDLIRAASRRGITIDLVVDGLDVFPLAKPLAPCCNLHDLATWTPLGAADFALIDEIPDRLLAPLPDHIPAFCVVHNAAARYSSALRDRCRGFLCMTETALRHQAKSIPVDKLVLIHQGVDLERFRSRSCLPRPPGSPRVLVSSRMDNEKCPTMLSIIELLVRTEVRLTVLGAGDAFWSLSDNFGDRMTLINHIPCHSLHHFLTDFDVVVSSGRGAMEALASGIPTLCAGYQYAGLITPENLLRLLESNLTGYGFGIDVATIAEDVAGAMRVSASSARALAEQYCSVDRYLDQLLHTVAESTGALSRSA